MIGLHLHRPNPLTATPSPPSSISEASAARAEAAEKLARTRAQRTRVERVADALHVTLQANHFADRLAAAFERNDDTP